MASARSSVVFASIAILAAACSAGSPLDTGSDNDDNNNGGGTTSGNNGGSTSNFGTGGSTSSGISGCTDPTCVGSTPQGDCDAGLTLDSANGMDGAKAMGLCKEYVEGGWGVKSAEWVRSDGQSLSNPAELLQGKGILGGFGSVAPREGSKLLAISSGAARAPSDAGFVDPGGYWKDDFPHGAPPGYPKESPACPGVITGEPYDSAGLRVVIQTPTDAKSISFNLDFYTYEYPDYVCSEFNDFFVAMMTPTPSGLVDGNISFDTAGNLISVNAAFLDQCNPSNAGGLNFPCTQGYGAISGTGFDSNQSFIYGIQGSGATGWLETKAPIEAPGSEITLHFAVWDSGDGVLDSTTLIDNFKFEADETNTGTTPVPE
jgi:hypothetical protein